MDSHLYYNIRCCCGLFNLTAYRKQQCQGGDITDTACIFTKDEYKPPSEDNIASKHPSENDITSDQPSMGDSKTERPSEDDFVAENSNERYLNYDMALQAALKQAEMKNSSRNFPGIGIASGGAAPNAIPTRWGGTPLFPGGVPPRGNFTQPPPMVNGPLKVEQVEIPSDCAGLVIGWHGTQMKQIKEACGCKIQMNERNQAPCNAPRILTIQGSRESIEKAKQMIMDVINQAGGRPQGGLGGGGYWAPPEGVGAPKRSGLNDSGGMFHAHQGNGFERIWMFG